MAADMAVADSFQGAHAPFALKGWDWLRLPTMQRYLVFSDTDGTIEGLPDDQQAMFCQAFGLGNPWEVLRAAAAPVRA